MKRLFIAASLAALAAGCQSTNPGVPDTQEDVPVPAGYTRAPDNETTKSYWSEQADYRNYRVTYRGTGKPGDATAFYQREMPRNGWTSETATPDATGGGAMLAFLKGNERAKIWTKLMPDEETTHVTVEIGSK